MSVLVHLPILTVREQHSQLTSFIASLGASAMLMPGVLDSTRSLTKSKTDCSGLRNGIL